MNKKLIFVDIDGTLTPAGSNVPPDSALRAIRRAQANGHRVFLCTGRNYAMLKPLLKYGFDGMVASAGGYVTVGDEVIYDCPMTREQTETALTSLHEGGVFCTIEAKDCTYGDENLNDFLKDQPAGNSEIERWRKALSSSLDIHPMREYDGRPVYKVVIMCMADSQLIPARRLLEKDFDFVIQEVPAHGCLNGELINRAFDKGKGVLRIAEKLGVPVEDTIGFGDSMNDLTMIQTVHTSVCMENGAKAFKEISTMVVPSVENDGLYRGFERLGLLQ
ncbi:MAG: HAD-IIB family hydrolase [Lachnospiraceae bacterium]|jgi:Cof subfamily protein (haloacid dehalogenase superfamily)